MAGQVQLWKLLARPFKTDVQALAADGRAIVDARGGWRLCVMAHSGATVTIHRVDGPKAWATPDTGTERDVTAPSAGAASAIDVDWPFYLIETSGGGCSFCLI